MILLLITSSFYLLSHISMYECWIFFYAPLDYFCIFLFKECMYICVCMVSLYVYGVEFIFCKGTLILNMFRDQTLFKQTVDNCSIYNSSTLHSSIINQFSILILCIHNSNSHFIYLFYFSSFCWIIQIHDLLC